MSLIEESLRGSWKSGLILSIRVLRFNLRSSQLYLMARLFSLQLPHLSQEVLSLPN